MAKELKGGTCGANMSEEALLLEQEGEEHDVLPFRLRNINPFFEFSSIHELGNSMYKIQFELNFQ